jgi:hypothetical protein
MSTQFMPSTSWRTASFADISAATSTDTSALGAHLDVCRQQRGSMLVMRRGAELMHGFFAGRFVTTLAVIALTIGVGSLVF